MYSGYNLDAAKRPVNLSLNEDLVRKVRELTGNLSDQVERLLATFLVEEQIRRVDAQATLQKALLAWNDFGARAGSFADEHSTL